MISGVSVGWTSQAKQSPVPSGEKDRSANATSRNGTMKIASARVLRKMRSSRMASCTPPRLGASTLAATESPPCKKYGPATAVLLIGTLDSKGAELAFMRDRLVAAGVEVILADVGTQGPPHGAEPDITREQIVDD